MGPGGEKKKPYGRIDCESPYRRTRVTFYGTKVREPLLAVSGVIDKKATLWSSMGAEPLHCNVNALVLVL